MLADAGAAAGDQHGRAVQAHGGGGGEGGGGGKWRRRRGRQGVAGRGAQRGVGRCGAWRLRGPVSSQVSPLVTHQPAACWQQGPPLPTPLPAWPGRVPPPPPPGRPTRSAGGPVYRVSSLEGKGVNSLSLSLSPLSVIRGCILHSYVL